MCMLIHVWVHIYMWKTEGNLRYNPTVGGMDGTQVLVFMFMVSIL